jgi:hypothetical protein
MPTTIGALTQKTTPADADLLEIEDTQTSPNTAKKITVNSLVSAGDGLTESGRTLAVDTSNSFTPTWAGKHQFDAETTFSPGNQAYVYDAKGSNSNNLTFAGKGDRFLLSTLTPTGDGSEPNLVRMYAEGSDPSNDSDMARLTFGYNSGKYIFKTSASGTGTHKPIKFSVGGTTNQLALATGGNVGIGTSNPSRQLDVQKELIAGRSTTLEATPVQWTHVNADARTWHLQSGIDGVSHAYAAIGNAENNEEIITLTNAGNIGIGETDPNRKLEIAGSSSRARFVGGGATGWGFEDGSGNRQAFIGYSTSGGIFQVFMDSPGNRIMEFHDGERSPRLPQIPSGSNNAVHVDGNKQLIENTSTRRHKTNYRPADVDVDAAVSLQPEIYRRTDNAPDREFLALTVEPFHEAGFENALVYDEEGRPRMFAEGGRGIDAMQQAVLRDHHDELYTDEGEARIDRLERENRALREALDQADIPIPEPEPA